MLVTLRVQVDSCGPSDVSALVQILLGGTPIRCRNHHLWIHAVRDYFDDAPLFVPDCQLLRFVCGTAPQHGCKVCVATLNGGTSNADLEELTQGSVPFPEGGVHVHIRPADTEVSGALQERVRNWSTLTAQGWVAMIWVASKTMISAYARTNIVSQFMALR